MDWQNIAVSVDVVLFTVQDEQLKILLVKRPSEPFKGEWGLPGGFVLPDEGVDASAVRILKEKAHISNLYLEQLYTFGDLPQDPRGRVMSVSYYTVVNQSKIELSLKEKKGEIALFSARPIPQMPFAHSKIVQSALERLKHKVNYTTICFQLLDQEFTFTQLQKAYEVILGEKLDKRNFRKKMLQLGLLKDLNRVRHEDKKKPARLYSFKENGVVKLKEKGILVPF